MTASICANVINTKMLHNVLMAPKQRLDLELVERKLVETRTRAQSLIMARRIKVKGQYVTKPGAPVSTGDEIEIVALEHPYVSRGGMKLAHALEHFQLSVAGRTCLDIGASTGGFTDVLLRQGARKVFAIDVGYGQIDAKMRSDPAVVVRDRINARYLQKSDFEEPIEFACIDVSFIPLRLILPPVAQILEPTGSLVALIKPQFEVGREGLGKGGIVRDESRRDGAVAEVTAFAAEIGLTVHEVILSPIKGAEGNIEYLMHATRSSV